MTENLGPEFKLHEWGGGRDRYRLSEVWEKRLLSFNAIAVLSRGHHLRKIGVSSELNL